MLADLGYAALVISFVTAIYAVVTSTYLLLGQPSPKARQMWANSLRNSTRIIFPLVFLSCAIIVVSLLRSDFSLDYVWRVSSIEMPTYLKITALWGGQAGSLLFWNLLLAAFIAAAMSRDWRDRPELMPYVAGTLAITQLFFLYISLGVENPFARLDPVPLDGNGLNPLLRHPGMIIHPPMLYLGFTGLVIPFSFALAVLLSGQIDDSWLRLTRRWTLVGWLFLTVGLILGGRWAYDVLGWGGYWAWDPVENASFMPWLAATAFLHSVIIQEKRGMFRQWNMFLIILTYLLMIYGTFIVRSGVISSVHAFAQSGIGPRFFIFLTLMSIISFGALFYRWNDLASANQLNSFFSREAAFLTNNFVILGILFVTFFGTNYPIISELITGEQATVAQPFYERATGPLFAILIFLMGIAPLTMYYKTSIQRLGRAIAWPLLSATIITIVLFGAGMRQWAALIGVWVTTFSLIITLAEFWVASRARMRTKGESFFTALNTTISRNRRRYGGYAIHLGVLLIAFGVIGSRIYQETTQIRLFEGESTSLGRYEMTFKGVERYAGPDDLLITEATVDVFDRGELVKTIYPRTELYTRTGQPMTIPDLRTTISEDFYVLMVYWEETTANAATFRIYLNPLINWVWFGSILMTIGTFIAGWPDPRESRVVAATATRRRVTVTA
ncbi:MAG TPA: heme lyase CcmF/NrfE family subunit [Anaerolineae bacterium]|nr:heme lyase CcmF/NrfE family subunit [Anaerolineae bacterium]